MSRVARTLRIAVLLPWLVAAIPDVPPAPVALTDAELTSLSARQVVVRYDTASDTGGGAMGVLDVAAPVAQVWTALLDFPARVGETSGLKSATVTTRTERSITARWELKVLTTTIVFHAIYQLSPDQGWVRYGLDSSQQNDLLLLEGAYQLYEVPGGTRLVYRSESDSGRSIPGWVKRWLAVDSLSALLEGVRTRAEAAR